MLIEDAGEEEKILRPGLLGTDSLDPSNLVECLFIQAVDRRHWINIMVEQH